jgi:hypothetical protein
MGSRTVCEREKTCIPILKASYYASLIFSSGCSLEPSIASTNSIHGLFVFLYFVATCSKIRHRL